MQTAGITGKALGTDKAGLERGGAVGTGNDADLHIPVSGMAAAKDSARQTPEKGRSKLTGRCMG